MHISAPSVKSSVLGPNTLLSALLSRKIRRRFLVLCETKDRVYTELPHVVPVIEAFEAGLLIYAPLDH